MYPTVIECDDNRSSFAPDHVNLNEHSHACFQSVDNVSSYFHRYIACESDLMRCYSYIGEPLHAHVAASLLPGAS